METVLGSPRNGRGIVDEGRHISSDPYIQRATESVAQKKAQEERRQKDMSAGVDQALATMPIHVEQSVVRTGWTSIDDVKKNVLAAYGGGNNKLNNEQIAAVVAIAWNMGLDPSPGMGHLWAYTDNRGKFVIQIGYQGYLYRAQKERQIYYNSPRAMTLEERQERRLREDQIGVVCELHDVARFRIAKEMGIAAEPIRGVGIWSPGDNVAKSKDGFWMAQKNAIKDAVRQLGLGFGSLAIPQLPGLEYDRDTDSFASISNPNPPVEVVSSLAPADDPIEAEILASLEQTIPQEAPTTPLEAPPANLAEQPAETPAPKSEQPLAPDDLKQWFLRQRELETMTGDPLKLVDYPAFERALTPKTQANMGLVYHLLADVFGVKNCIELTRREGAAALTWLKRPTAQAEYELWKAAYTARPPQPIATLPNGVDVYASAPAPVETAPDDEAIVAEYFGPKEIRERAALALAEMVRYEGDPIPDEEADDEAA